MEWTTLFILGPLNPAVYKIIYRLEKLKFCSTNRNDADRNFNIFTKKNPCKEIDVLSTYIITKWLEESHKPKANIKL